LLAPPEDPGPVPITAAPPTVGAAPPAAIRPVASAASAKQELPTGRVSSAPRAPGRPQDSPESRPGAPATPTRTVTLPDEVVVKVMGGSQPAFLRCWLRAQRIDGLATAKVRLHLDIDAHGAVTACRSQSDAESDSLSSCLRVIARQLRFPSPGVPAAVDLPLMFR
jgi:hypothetical protein